MGEEDKEILLDDQQFIEAIREAGLSKTLDNYTSKIADKRVSEGVNTFKKNQESKNLTDKERIESLETELKEIKAEKAKNNLETQIKAELKKEGLSEDLIKYVRVNDPDKVGESVKALKEDFQNLQQKNIDTRLKEGGIPAKGDTSDKADSVIEKFVESKNKGQAGGPFEGKSTENKSEGD